MPIYPLGYHTTCIGKW